MIQRKPESIYGVEYDGRVGLVSKTGDDQRSLRWKLELVDGESKHFKSRREAFYFFETGKKYETNPTYIMQGQKGVRVR